VWAQDSAGGLAGCGTVPSKLESLAAPFEGGAGAQRVHCPGGHGAAAGRQRQASRRISFTGRADLYVDLSTKIFAGLSLGCALDAIAMRRCVPSHGARPTGYHGEVVGLRKG